MRKELLTQIRRGKWKGDSDSFSDNVWMIFVKMNPEFARIEFFSLNFIKNQIFG